MDEQAPKRSRSSWTWLLVLIAIGVAWWWFRDPGARKQAQINADDPAAQAAIDRDDILVDLKDNASPAQVAAIERDLGIKLELVDSNEAVKTQLYRAHVQPGREDAVVAALSARPEVEIAEPDSFVQLDKSEMADAAPIGATHEGFPNDPLYVKQWNLRQIGMPQAWKLAQGNGVTVAVLDTGVAYENYGRFHKLPDLEG